MNLIGTVGGPEPVAIIDKDNRLILGWKMDMDNHIRLMITTDVAELYCDRSQITPIAIDIYRSNIADRFGRFSTHEFNDDSLTIEVDGDKVTGVPRAFVMSHIRISLIGAWNTITKIIVALVRPGEGRDTEHPQDNSCEHAHAEREHPMHILAFLDLLIWLCYVVWAA